MAQITGAGIDGHRHRHVGKGNATKQNLHILERADGDAALAHFALGRRMVRVVTHQRGQIERHRQPGLSLTQQIQISPIGLLGSGEPENWRMVQSLPRYMLS